MSISGSRNVVVQKYAILLIIRILNKYYSSQRALYSLLKQICIINKIIFQNIVINY